MTKTLPDKREVSRKIREVRTLLGNPSGLTDRAKAGEEAMTGEELNLHYHELCGWKFAVREVRLFASKDDVDSGKLTPSLVELWWPPNGDTASGRKNLPAIHLDANLAIQEADRVFKKWEMYRANGKHTFKASIDNVLWQHEGFDDPMTDTNERESPRQIDARIAEKVFGWKAWQSKHGYWNLDDADGNRIEVVEMGPPFDPDTGVKLDRSQWWEYSGSLSAYSTNAEASKQLRAKLAEMGWNYDLGRYGYKPAIFTLTLYRNGVRFSADSGESEEHVFALCALKAVGDSQ